jgi:HEPN domain-containing protein
MNKDDKYLHWEDIASYDLETAESMLKSGRYLYVVFMCQQSIEKLAKGLHVWVTDSEPPRTHNINLVIRPIFELLQVQIMDEQRLENETFFAELLAYYISERYPSYREKLSESIKQDKAQQVLEKTKKVFTWLKSLKTS